MSNKGVHVVSANRALLLGAFMMGLGTACVLGSAGTAGKSSVRFLEIVDKDGKTRIRIGAPDDGSATFAIYDTAGNTRASLTASADGSAGILISDGPAKQVFLGNIPNIGSALTLSHGLASIGMTVSPRESGAQSSLEIRDTHERKRLALYSDDTDTNLLFKDRQEKDRLSLSRSDRKLSYTSLSLDRYPGSPVITLNDYGTEASVLLIGKTALQFADDVNDQPRKVIR